VLELPDVGNCSRRQHQPISGRRTRGRCSPGHEPSIGGGLGGGRWMAVGLPPSCRPSRNVPWASGLPLGSACDQLGHSGSVLVVRDPRSLDRRDVTPGLIRSRSAAVRPPRPWVCLVACDGQTARTLWFTVRRAPENPCKRGVLQAGCKRPEGSHVYEPGSSASLVARVERLPVRPPRRPVRPRLIASCSCAIP
jgi:hypothetical protein